MTVVKHRSTGIAGGALLMLFAGIVSEDVGIQPFGYITAMVVTIALWLALAPAIGAVVRAPRKSKD